MNQKNYYTICLLLLVGILFNSCIKEPQRIIPLSVGETLVSHPWKYKSIIKNGKVDLNECDKDDIIFYLPDFKYKSILGPLLCSWGPQQNELEGTWQLIKQDSTIKATQFFSGVPLTTEANIIFITKDSFQVNTNVLGTNFTLTYIPK
ncbi:MAG: hypothetical protein WAS56_10570 [Saprospiraceae bacterium]|nr:hypothetical protein [Saprospiraceae bacterium]MBK7465870.1 hypothetical protein [Saprospiraceae bacterium]MBK9993303.1 hypothetical protein [Saprospiraceae bacterium]